MKKISLNLEDLGVQSFETTSSMATERGTVQGHADTVEQADSCAATWCGGSQCDTNACASVNVLYCPSAQYTDCNCNWDGSGRPTDIMDPWWNASNCS
jgi:hypothetical protein